MTATCGAEFEHEWHAFENEQGHIEVCDGSISKPGPRPKAPNSSSSN